MSYKIPRLAALEIESLDMDVEFLLEEFKLLNKFKVGDYLVCYAVNSEGKKRLLLNSYGAARKFKVVHVSNVGVPYLVEVLGSNRFSGSMYPGIFQNKYFDFFKSFKDTLDNLENLDEKMITFAEDPEYLDSIVMETEYNPVLSQKDKKDLHKDITEHNKNARYKTKTIADVKKLVSDLQVGDRIYTSANKSYLVVDKKNIDIKSAYTNNIAFTPRLPRVFNHDKYVDILTIVCSKTNKTYNVVYHFFVGKTLYKHQPRSYNELKR